MHGSRVRKIGQVQCYAKQLVPGTGFQPAVIEPRELERFQTIRFQLVWHTARNALSFWFSLCGE